VAQANAVAGFGIPQKVQTIRSRLPSIGSDVVATTIGFPV
jgi:hypothetical protein